ncbi:iron-containing alcohol dehydrogenase family protein [Haloarcula halophila]|uniref:iron-containing alcohol dehydrogenase family protein n=1 Tax=Haloarcula TaxID=2237 RepID=UPI0023E392B7|nr:iron-containing alcohol dehydrogenase family protein [Halomicroarcula sp. DFY41]
MSTDFDRLGEPFRFDYESAVLRYDPEGLGDLGAELTAHDCERALVVCGETVGSTPAVMDPIRRGLDTHLTELFARTTPEKRLGTAIDAYRAFTESSADSIVAVGGGSSLDLAKVTAVLVASDASPAEIGAEFAETGSISVPESGLPPIVAVPTTLAGADLTQVAGLTADPATCPVESPVSGGISARGLMPAAVWYDPSLIATTPETVLAGSAMNGFDKGIETLYASTATPVTDATASRGLDLLQRGLLALGSADSETNSDEWVYQALTQGIMLVQYGISRPAVTTLSLIHAFGHGLTRTYPVQQGAAHGVVAPHVLRYLFDAVDGRRELLADALGVGDADDSAEAVVGAVKEVAGALSLPTRLRDVDGPEQSEFPAVARAILDDVFVRNAPNGLDPTQADIEAILEAAW